MNKDIKFINDGNPLTFDGNNFAIDTQTGNAFFSGDFRNAVLTVVGTGNVIVYGSTQKTPPDFSSPSTPTNSYASIVLADYSLANTYYAGNTGVTVSGSTAIVELNTNLLTWVGIKRDDLEVDVILTFTNNQ